MQLSAGSGLPTAPLDEWKLYFPESGDFGLFKPYGAEDYKRAQTFVQNLGSTSLRASTWEEAEAAKRPAFAPAPEWIPSTTSALTLGAANTPLNASINSDWLLPTGAGAMGAKFAFGGIKTMLPILAAGARTEVRLLSAEMRTGKILAGATAKGGTPFESMLTKVKALDFSTTPNKAVFYSGPGQGVRATAFAKRTGGMTIEMTAGGRALAADPVFQALSPAEQFKIWQSASTPFANEASGGINAFIRGALPDRTFRSIEEPLLRANSGVFKSTYHY
jgi:hypothetical protein